MAGIKKTKPPRTDGICSDCEQPIPNYLANPGGVGYVSPLSDQLPNSVAEVMLLGERAFMAIPRPVCMACYCKAFNEMYDGEPCPLQEQSDFIHADLARARRLGLLLSNPIVIQDPLAEEIQQEIPSKANEASA